MADDLVLYAHPFSSYCWKVLIALWENDTPFAYRRLDDPDAHVAWKALSPMERMPLLVDRGTPVPEATIIIEHLQIHHPGPARMIPADPAEALQVRLLDRMSDNYLMAGLMTIVFDAIRPEPERDPLGVAKARAQLDRAYGWWDRHMDGREWAADAFGLADCAAGPALFYVDWAHPIPESFPHLRAYRTRLLARPSIARAVEEARPHRHLFPLGAPDRD